MTTDMTMPATKQDIRDMATKQDIADIRKEMATKKDIADHAKITKQDLANHARANRQDLANLARAVKFMEGTIRQDMVDLGTKLIAVFEKKLEKNLEEMKTHFDTSVENFREELASIDTDKLKSHDSRLTFMEIYLGIDGRAR